MAKVQLNARVSDLTRRQLDELGSRWGTSQTETLTVIIDRMFQQENQTMDTWTPELLKQKRPYVPVIDGSGHKYNGYMIDIGKSTATLVFGSFNRVGVPLQSIADALNANQPLGSE